ncbi:MAG: GTP 3',8-cyclase MoaA [Aristaeellaceae bacterium]
MLDRYGRDINYVRISITDRCNLRCVYCMPDGGVKSMGHDDILSYEEILRVVRALAALGIRHVRVTGGEPMARRDCLSLVERIHAVAGIETVSMTTNGLLLDGCVAWAKEAGIDALNVSLDTLNPDTYRRMTRGGDVTRVLHVLDEALSLGIKVKINAVPVRGMNEDDLVELAALAKEKPLCVRFIELMPVGCGAALCPIPNDEVKEKLAAAFGPLLPDNSRHGLGPAQYMRPEGFCGSIGLISPMSHEFCGACNRVRLTADGFLKLCLNHRAGVDLRTLMRNGADDLQLQSALREAIAAKPARHGFGEAVQDCEVRRMNEIGG